MLPCFECWIKSFQIPKMWTFCPVMSLQNLTWLNKAITLNCYLNILDLSLNFLLLLFLIDLWWGLTVLYLIFLFWVFLCLKFLVCCNLYFWIIFFLNLLERFLLLLPFLLAGISPDLELPLPLMLKRMALLPDLCLGFLLLAFGLESLLVFMLKKRALLLPELFFSFFLLLLFLKLVFCPELLSILKKRALFCSELSLRFFLFLTFPAVKVSLDRVLL